MVLLEIIHLQLMVHIQQDVLSMEKLQHLQLVNNQLLYEEGEVDLDLDVRELMLP